MQIFLGLVFFFVGLVGWCGQLVSAVHFKKAQRWGLQEKNEHTDPIFRTAELNAARWDTVVLWTLILVGVFMVIDHALWPVVALIAGGIHLDAGGREAAKYISLRRQGVRVGSPVNVKVAFGTFATLLLVGLLLILYTLHSGRL